MRCLLVSARFESQTVVYHLGLLVEMALANDVYKFEDNEDDSDDDDNGGDSVDRKQSVECRHCLMP